MTLPTADDVRSEPAGRRLDAWVAYHWFGWRWYPDKRRGMYSFQPPTVPKSNELQIGVWTQYPWGPDVYGPPIDGWPDKSKWYDDWDTSGRRWLDHYHIESGFPRVSTDPAACAELRRHLWVSGRTYDVQVERKSVVATLWDENDMDVLHHKEPIGTDPIAAECAAWAKVALLAKIGETTAATT